MLIEILLVFFLCRNISKMAERKDQPKRTWIIKTIQYWLLAEILMGCILIFGFGFDIEAEQDQIYMSIIGSLAGFLGYLLVKKQLEELPD